MSNDHMQCACLSLYPPPLDTHPAFHQTTTVLPARAGASGTINTCTLLPQQSHFTAWCRYQEKHAQWIRLLSCTCVYCPWDHSLAPVHPTASVLMIPVLVVLEVMTMHLWPVFSLPTTLLWLQEETPSKLSHEHTYVHDRNACSSLMHTRLVVNLCFCVHACAARLFVPATMSSLTMLHKILTASLKTPLIKSLIFVIHMAAACASFRIQTGS